MADIDCSQKPGARWHFVGDRTCEHAETTRVKLGTTATDVLYGRKCKNCKGLLYR